MIRQGLATDYSTDSTHVRGQRPEIGVRKLQIPVSVFKVLEEVPIMAKLALRLMGVVKGDRRRWL